MNTWLIVAGLVALYVAARVAWEIALPEGAVEIARLRMPET